MDLDVLTATAGELEHLLSSSTSGIDSKYLVKTYLAQISRHDAHLKAVVGTAPESILFERADMLDDERKQGKIRSPLHGIPIINKDNIATNASTGLDTTAGSLALVNSRPRENAAIVDRLLDAGAILLAKASLGTGLISGWSAVSGQAQSPYVRGGVLDGNTFSGHSNPGGSSSGSTIAVAAGFSPISIGTETFGSLMLPAGRAALYSLKPGRGHISTAGIVPISSFSDQPGPMTKTTRDLAMLMDVMTDPDRIPPGGYISRVTGSWDGLKIGTLDPAKWKFSANTRKILDEQMEKQLDGQVREAYKVIEQHASSFHHNVPLSSKNVLTLNGEDVLAKIFEFDFRGEFENYLKLLDSPQIRSLGELIEFNEKHADKELPPGNGNQDVLERCYNTSITPEERSVYAAHADKYGRELGVDKILEEYNLNIIMGPLESPLASIAAACGYPVAAMPLGYLDFNGQPHGLCAVARDEGLLIQLQSAFEATFPHRKSPPL
ncbi:hypothetical protein ACJ41O_014718 [Fusarium nematophilum]